MAMATRFAAHLICTTYLLHVSAVQCTTHYQMPDSVVEPGTVQNHNPTSGMTLETLPTNLVYRIQLQVPLRHFARWSPLQKY
ncbi:hypothetical protein CY34DRAFT_814110 [Suillus luteus UH-Slu-Lm8-n1]|uniref:Secreted protein n=1 Tax=Suillus luteus UH-Slu-Lm8-n1 TaxID=930992 RepID=A0A0D0ALA5_9AGAM|nr:hypothetical protein CY34DRAFT_814110 [Suillus luteus UH-Slu-Lm8-n1]